MERLNEIKEKGADSATPEDIPIGLGVITEFINTDSEAQELVKNMSLTGQFNIEKVGVFILKIANGKSEYAKKGVDEPNFSFFGDLKTITEVLIGQLDVSFAFITGIIGVEGDFEKMVDFFEVIELAYEKLGLIEVGEKITLIDAKTMRRFYNLYVEITADKDFDIDPSDIPLIFDIFKLFANENKDAQEILEDEEFCVQMLITDVGAYVVRAKDGVVSWDDKQIDDPTLQFKIGLNTAANVFLSGDAASAFLAGEIEADGNIAEALVLNDLVETFLELLPFTEKED